MTAGMTLAAILSLILALAGAGSTDATQQKTLQERQQEFEKLLRDKTVTTNEAERL